MVAVPTSPLARLDLARRSRRPIPGVSRLRAILRASRGHGLWIALWSIVGWVGTALAPALADQPLLLMLLSPRALFVALASGSVSLIPFVVLGTLRLSVTDASYFIIGRKFPETALPKAASQQSVGRVRHVLNRVTSRGDRACRFLCQRPSLAGAFLFVRPNSRYLLLDCPQLRGLQLSWQLFTWASEPSSKACLHGELLHLRCLQREHAGNPRSQGFRQKPLMTFLHCGVHKLPVDALVLVEPIDTHARLDDRVDD